MVIALVTCFVLIVSVGARHGQVFQRSDWLRLLPVALLAPFILILAAQGHDVLAAPPRSDSVFPKSRRDAPSVSSMETRIMRSIQRSVLVFLLIVSAGGMAHGSPSRP